MLYDFTTHLRASIRAMSNDDRIWFSQEMENIKAYVSIEKCGLANGCMWFMISGKWSL